jgi:hypothetical protein
MSVHRLYGKPIPKELDPPTFPPEATYILQTFSEIGQGRQGGIGGPAPVSWTEIKAYAELTQQVFEPWEIMLIKELDNAYINAVAIYSKEE